MQQLRSYGSSEHVTGGQDIGKREYTPTQIMDPDEHIYPGVAFRVVEQEQQKRNRTKKTSTKHQREKRSPEEILTKQRIQAGKHSLHRSASSVGRKRTQPGRALCLQRKPVRATSRPQSYKSSIAPRARPHPWKYPATTPLLHKS